MPGKISIYNAEAVALDTGENGFRINWDSSVGFGNTDIVFDVDGVFHLYTNGMDTAYNRGFTRALLSELVDTAIVED